MSLVVIDLSEVAGFRYDYVALSRWQFDDEFRLHLSLRESTLNPVYRRREDYLDIYVPNSITKRLGIIEHLH